ncbi:hypothetical protein GCM10029992_31570 [Glycomyces albus]
MAAAGGIAGVLLERVAFRPLAGRDDEHFAGLISSVAFGSVLIALLQARYGTEPQSFPVDYFPNRLYEIAGIRVTLVQLLTLGLAVALMLGLAWLVSKSSLGRSMRAVAENPTAARVVGVNVGRVTAGTYALSSSLGAVAGVLLAINLGQANRDLGLSIELIGFAVIILGGLGSLWGAMAAGLILGLAEALTIHWYDSTWKGMVAFALLFAVLVLRPKGLFGNVKVRRSDAGRLRHAHHHRRAGRDPRLLLLRRAHGRAAQPGPGRVRVAGGLHVHPGRADRAAVRLSRRC